MASTAAASLLRRSRSHLQARASSCAPLAAWAQQSGRVSAPFMVPGITANGGAVRTKVSDRAQRRKNLRKMKSGVEKVPLLKDTLRKLYLRTHPDLFGQYPKQRDQNEASYKELLGILDSIEKNNEFPPAKTLVLPFSLKTPVDGAFKEVALHLRTTGGACNTLVEEALGKFFVDCGLPGVFQWGEGSWGKALGKDKVQNSNLDFEKEDEEAKAREQAAAAEKARREAEYSAPAYNPVDRKAPEDNSIERVLNELNDVFEIIAAVPLMDEEEYGELRVYYEKGQGLNEIDARGYSIKDATHLIWEGERNMSVLTQGVDADSAMIIQRILMHTLAIEQKVKELIEKGVIDPEDVASDDDDDDEEGEFEEAEVSETTTTKAS